MAPSVYVPIPEHLSKVRGTSGGRLLEIERAKASFSVEALKTLLHGDEELERMNRILPILENEVRTTLLLPFHPSGLVILPSGRTPGKKALAAKSSLERDRPLCRTATALHRVWPDSYRLDGCVDAKADTVRSKQTARV